MITSIFICFLTYMLPFLYRGLRRSKIILLNYWIVVTLHHVVATCNAFFFYTIGADKDAIGFDLAGKELSKTHEFSFSIGAGFYDNMLGVAYSIFGSFHFLGEQLSILAFSISCAILIRLMNQLYLLKYQAITLLCFGGLPTMVFLGSITLRESYQILFFMAAVYFGIRMHLEGRLHRHLIPMILSALFMGLFHKGLVVYMFFLIILFLVFSIHPTSLSWSIKKSRLSLFFVILPIFSAFLLFALELEVPGLETLSSLASMGAGEYSSSYRGHSVVARASYGVELDLSTPLSFLGSAAVLYLYYLFSPFPWQIGNILDIYAALESLIRLVFIYYAIKHWRSTYGVQRRLFGLMLVLFFSMTFIWAMGTTNYGTAMRHHLLTWWIIVIIGMPPLMNSLLQISNLFDRKPVADDRR